MKIPMGTARQRRVVHLCARLPVGGMENVVVSLVRHLPASQFVNAIWCLEEGDVQGRELLARGEQVLELRKAPGRDVVLFFRVARLIRQHEVELLHCHDELSWFYGAVGARLAHRGTQVVMTMHGRRRNISRRHLLEQRFLAALTSSIVCVSKFLCDQIHSELMPDPRRVTTIKNGISLPVTFPSHHERQQARASLGIPPEAFVIGSVGELSPVKNLDLTLDAAAIAVGKRPDLRVVFVGDGAERQALAERVAELGLQENVLFAGWRRDIQNLLPALDIYVCSSHYEGISLSVLEAMARGRAIAATAVGGNPELIEHRRTGILVAAGNPLELADAILGLAANPHEREQLGREAQRKVSSAHGIDRMVQSYAALYQRLMAGSSDATAIL